MFKKLVLMSSSLVLIAACTVTPTVQTGEDAEVIGDNLHRIDNARVKVAYVDPDANFPKYSRVLVRPLGVDNVEIVQPDTRGSVNARRGNWELTDKDKESLQTMYQEAMVKQLQEKGHFEVVTEAGDDVLEIAAILTGIAPTAPKDDNRSRAAGRSYIATDSAGSLAVTVGIGDSETGDVLALIKDSRAAASHWGLNNSVTNRAEVQRVFNSWAAQISSSLANVTGRE